MNERIKNRIKLVSSFLMCVLSLSAAITLSFAWFAKNDTVNGGGMSVAIENDANVVGAEYFIAEKNGSNNGSTQLKFTKITDGKPVRMGAYDILDKKYQLLAKVYLKSDMETIRVTGNTQTAYFLGALDLENNKSKYPLLPPTSGDVNVPQESTAGDVTYTNVLSSVINFTIFQADELTALTNGSGYELVSDTLPSGNRIAKFIDSTDAEKPTSSINLVGDSDTVTTGGPEEFNGQRCRTLFIMFSYDEEIMEKIFSDNLGNTNMYTYIDGNLINIPFKCDFTISFDKFAG